MNLQDTDFDLFAVPPTFAQDRAQIDARWKQLQREVHPDRFASQGSAARRQASDASADRLGGSSAGSSASNSVSQNSHGLPASAA